MIISELKGRNIVVAGGTSGIGLASARRMASLGATVVVTGRNQERAASVGQQDPGLCVEVVDAASAIASKALYESVGLIDDLVLCVSGAKGGGRFTDITSEDLHEGFEQKFFTQFRGAQTAVPFLRKDGSLTFVSAISARAANPSTAGLAAINGAIEPMVSPWRESCGPCESMLSLQGWWKHHGGTSFPTICGRHYFNNRLPLRSSSEMVHPRKWPMPSSFCWRMDL